MSNIFLIIFFSSFIPLSLEQELNLTEFFNIAVTDSDDGNGDENDCACDINRNYCNYLCCCDTKCDESNITYWEDRFKCIDQKDILGIFADRCVDKNLIYKYNKRRGLNMAKETEDITINENVIENYCFSIDNYDKIKREIKPINLNNDEKRSIIKSITETSSTRLRRLDENNITANHNDNLYYYNYSGIDIINHGIFKNSNGEFSLYSGENCNSNSQVKILQSSNYTCSISKSNNLTNNIISGINADSHQKKIYRVQNGSLSTIELTDNNNINADDDIILEVEFILKKDENELNKISNYSINIVIANKNSELSGNNGTNINFKNSVIFSNDITKIPYRFSGTIEYIIGNPLKVAINNSIYNEFYIVGKDNSGNCRIDNNIDNYLYFDDKPILFNQDISYSCNYSNITNINDLTQFTLFNKLNSISMVGKYGNSYTNKEDWIEVDNNLNSTEINKTLIKMDIYLGTKNIGINSYKYIYKVTFKNKENIRNNNNIYTYLTLDINYHDLNAKKEYEITPQLPAFVPSMPLDLLDPLIYSNVDK